KTPPRKTSCSGPTAMDWAVAFPGKALAQGSEDGAAGCPSSTVVVEQPADRAAAASKPNAKTTELRIHGVKAGLVPSKIVVVSAGFPLNVSRSVPGLRALDQPGRGLTSPRARLRSEEAFAATRASRGPRRAPRGPDCGRFPCCGGAPR